MDCYENTPQSSFSIGPNYRGASCYASTIEKPAFTYINPAPMHFMISRHVLIFESRQTYMEGLDGIKLSHFKWLQKLSNFGLQGRRTTQPKDLLNAFREKYPHVKVRMEWVYVTFAGFALWNHGLKPWWMMRTFTICTQVYLFCNVNRHQKELTGCCYTPSGIKSCTPHMHSCMQHQKSVLYIKSKQWVSLKVLGEYCLDSRATLLGASLFTAWAGWS